MPPHGMVGRSVLLVRASVQCAERAAHATNVYAFGVVSTDDAEDDLVRSPVLILSLSRSLARSLRPPRLSDSVRARACAYSRTESLQD